jgi:hypothetical protein
MGYVDAIGWIAAALTLATFSMRTMIPLRLTAISSNAAFIAYGGLAGFYPAFVLHCVLLPFNLYRLYEMKRLTERIEHAAQGSFAADAMKPFMSRSRMSAGDVIFRQGDAVDHVYFVSYGTVYLREVDQKLGPGQVFGEIGFFLSDQKRTLTVVCDTNCELFTISAAALRAPRKMSRPSVIPVESPM